MQTDRMRIMRVDRKPMKGIYIFNNPWITLTKTSAYAMISPACPMLNELTVFNHWVTHNVAVHLFVNVLRGF